MTWRQATFVVWAVVGSGLIGCQLVALRSTGRLPTTGDLVRFMTSGAVRRTLLVLAWMWLGWHAFAR